MSVQVEGRPQRVQWARLLRVEPKPRLAAAAPVQQADWTGVEVPAAAAHIVPTQTVLVPPVLDGRYVSSEDQQEWRQRAELVDPARARLLYLHPPLDAARVPEAPPPRQIYHHDAGVEVARIPAREYAGEGGARPEMLREVFGKVRVAVLRRADRFLPQRRAPELRDVVDHHEIRIQVDDAIDAGF